MAVAVGLAPEAGAALAVLVVALRRALVDAEAEGEAEEGDALDVDERALCWLVGDNMRQGIT